MKDLTFKKLSDRSKIGLPRSQPWKIAKLIEKAGPELGDMTLGEYVDLVKDPKKAALKQAGEKQGKLPGKLGEYGMEYQRKWNIALKFKEGSTSIEWIISKWDDGSIKEEKLAEYALRINEWSTNLPNWGRVVRSSGPNWEMKISYFSDTSKTKPDFILADSWKWEKPKWSV